MKQILISIGIIIVYITLAVVLTSNVKADDPMHRVKRIKEHVVLQTKMTPEDKLEYYRYLVNERFYDVEYVYKWELFDYILPINSRYTVTANKLVKATKKLNNEEESKKTIRQLSEQKEKLTEFSETFDNVKENASTFADSANYLGIYLAELE